MNYVLKAPWTGNFIYLMVYENLQDIHDLYIQFTIGDFVLISTYFIHINLYVRHAW
jgi:hypothetical protein